MAFALSIRNTVSEIRQIFFTTTCLITIATVIFNGGMTVPVLSLLKVNFLLNSRNRISQIYFQTIKTINYGFAVFKLLL